MKRQSYLGQPPFVWQFVCEFFGALIVAGTAFLLLAAVVVLLLLAVLPCSSVHVQGVLVPFPTVLPSFAPTRCFPIVAPPVSFVVISL